MQACPRHVALLCIDCFLRQLQTLCCIKAGFELMILLPLWPECWDIGIHHWCTALFSLIFNSVLILGWLCVRRCTSDVGKTGAFLLWKYIFKIQTFHNSLRSSCIYFEYLHHFAPPLQFFPRSGGNFLFVFKFEHCYFFVPPLNVDQKSRGDFKGG